jgi:arylsulfatase A-like enzyme
MLAIFGAFAAVSDPASASAADAPRPNILVVLMDDLGWKDPRCCGGTFIDTPRADRLAAEGMRFTQAYAAAPVCSPTRASLLTGRWPGRLGMYEVLNLVPRPFARRIPPPNRTVLPNDAATIAEILSPAGYVCGSFGKWHVGRTPQEEGFAPPSDPVPDSDLDAWVAERPHKKIGPIAGEAVRFLRAHRDRPFMLWVNHHAVHAPLAAAADLVEKYRARATAAGVTDIDPVYAAMTEEGDQASVGCSTRSRPWGWRTARWSSSRPTTAGWFRICTSTRRFRWRPATSRCVRRRAISMRAESVSP